MFNQDAQHLPAPPENGDKDGWAAANGGIPASGNYIDVTLQGLNGHTVVVSSISADITSRRDPLQGTYTTLGCGCGGLIPYRFSLNGAGTAHLTLRG